MTEAIVKQERVEMMPRTPQDVVDLTAQQSELLMTIVNEQNLFTTIQGRKYLHVEAWELIGQFDGVFAMIETVEPYKSDKETGFKATAKLVNRDGKEVGAGVGICTREEGNKSRQLDFQIASMAQTRAVSRAFRLKYSFVAALAGFAPTPYEEMQNGGSEAQSQKPPAKTSKPKPKPKQKPKVVAPKESDLETARKAAFAKANELSISDRHLKAYCCNKYDVDSRKEMTIGQWNNVYRDLEKGKVQEWIDSQQCTLDLEKNGDNDNQNQQQDKPQQKQPALDIPKTISEIAQIGNLAYEDDVKKWICNRYKLDRIEDLTLGIANNAKKRAKEGIAKKEIEEMLAGSTDSTLNGIDSSASYHRPVVK